MLRTCPMEPTICTALIVWRPRSTIQRSQITHLRCYWTTSTTARWPMNRTYPTYQAFRTHIDWQPLRKPVASSWIVTILGTALLWREASRSKTQSWRSSSMGPRTTSGSRMLLCWRNSMNWRTLSKGWGLNLRFMGTKRGKGCLSTMTGSPSWWRWLIPNFLQSLPKSTTQNHHFKTS